MYMFIKQGFKFVLAHPGNNQAIFDILDEVK